MLVSVADSYVCETSLPEFGSLPSVIFFAECFFPGTRQRSSLPSVTQKTLGKRKHSAKKLFAECFIFVTNTTLGKELFAECFFPTLGKDNLKNHILKQ
jgi:hypothetical protein